MVAEPRATGRHQHTETWGEGSRKRGHHTRDWWPINQQVQVSLGCIICSSHCLLSSLDLSVCLLVLEQTRLCQGEKLILKSQVHNTKLFI